MNDNLFDEDSTLDYLLSEENEKEINNRDNNSSCLRTILLFLFPGSFVYFMLSML